MSNIKGYTARDAMFRLRDRGWSDKSIARHLGLPLDAVRGALGITLYGPDGNPRLPVVTLGGPSDAHVLAEPSSRLDASGREVAR